MTKYYYAYMDAEMTSTTSPQPPPKRQGEETDDDILDKLTWCV